MPAIPPSNPLTPDAIGFRALNLRTANGTTDRDQAGALIPAGTVYVSITPCLWAGDTYVADLAPLVLTDVGAWLTGLATGGDALAAAAAAKFAESQTDLLWLLRLLLSASGACARPTA